MTIRISNKNGIAFTPAAQRRVAAPANGQATSHANGRVQSPRQRMSGYSAAALIAVLFALLNLVIWQVANPSVAVPDAPPTVTGYAYNAFGRWDSPLSRTYPDDASIERDMALLSEHTNRVRTYSSAELPQLPAIADAHGLKITAGIWLDLNKANNEREITAAVNAARHNSNIERLIVGNESILHGTVSPARMIAYLQQVKAQVKVAVSTAEPWHIWLRYPQLVEHVDYITVHLLPYWEGVPHDKAVDYAFTRLAQLKEKFPNKTIVIGEIGWPAEGDRFGAAQPGRIEQALFVREFLARSQTRRLDYFLMEAIDQPWKRESEGRVGAYWGLMNADRSTKFAFTGPIASDPMWQEKATLSTGLGLVAVLLFLFVFRPMRLASRVFFAALIQGSAALVVWMLAVPLNFYMRAIDWFGLAILVPTVGIMVAIVLANAFEFAEMFWHGNLKRRYRAKLVAPNGREPKVSIHLACCNEPPDMVIETINSLLALDYKNFEVLVVDNNTKDENLWRPLAEHIAKLDSRFRFFHLPDWPGFKAGALNFALDQTAADAEVVGVVDADYVVRSNWLAELVGHFDDEKVAVVQAPQAHRDWQRQPFQRMMNWEFDGFFRIGMHHRNERDAIIQHGTMTLVRATALREHGQWSAWCICEDTELGLRLMQAGYRTVYVDRVMGEGLTPDTFAAFRKQRRRWAQGAMQIMRAHWRLIFLGRDPKNPSARLSMGQRYHFVAGWLPWIGDALHLVFAFAAMFWTIGMIAAPSIFSLPITLFALPVFGLFVCRAIMGPLLYWRRVPCSLRDVVGAAVAGMGVSHGIALGVFSGLTGRKAVFEITEKAAKKTEAGLLNQDSSAKTTATKASSRAVAWSAIREEAGLLTALLLCIGAMLIAREAMHVESQLWVLLLGLQALPYLAALICSLIARLPETSSSELTRQSSGTLNRGGLPVIASTLPVSERRPSTVVRSPVISQRTAQHAEPPRNWR